MAQNINKHAWLTGARGKLLELRTDGDTRLGSATENDIVLNDSTVSRRHAVISFDDGRAFLRDLGSSNGTFINGSKVTGGQLKNGSEIKFGRVAFVYRESVGDRIPLPPVSSLRDQVRTSGAAIWTALSKRNFSSTSALMTLGALFLLGLAATLIGHTLFSTSSPSVGRSNFGNLVDSQSYRLPDASSDFVGDWCGWSQVVSCEPAGSCDEEPAPESMGFLSDSGGVVMQYAIMASSDTQIGDIDVHVLDSRHVRVASVARRTDSTGARILINDRDDIVSVNTRVVRVTSSLISSVNGISMRSEEKSAQLAKCSDEFRASEQKYEEGKNMVEKGEVTGKIPSK